MALGPERFRTQIQYQEDSTRGFDLRFEDIGRTLQDRRLSRRSAVVKGAGALAAGAAALTGLHAATAQEAGATPEAATGEKTMYLFVQSYQSGSIAPSASAFGTHTVTLDQGWEQTIYFGDRPSRDVGAGSTVDFLAGLGFEPEKPPNAALIVETVPGETDGSELTPMMWSDWCRSIPIMRRSGSGTGRC